MKKHGNSYAQDELDNYSRQLNPEDETFHKARQVSASDQDDDDYEQDAYEEEEDDGIEPLPPGGYLFDWDW